MTPQRATPLDLQEGMNALPSGAQVRWSAGRAELLAGRDPATINDVAAHGSTLMRVGDMIVQGQSTYLVLPGSRPTARATRVLTHAAWAMRVDEELAAGEGVFTVLLGRSGAFSHDRLNSAVEASKGTIGSRFLVGRSGQDLIGLLLIGSAQEREEFLRQTLAAAANRDGDTVRWGASRYPDDGGTGETLLGVALDRLLGLESSQPEALEWSDACMMRLTGLAERLAPRIRSLSLLGEEGVGRESLARFVRTRGAPGSPFVVHRSVRFDRQRWNEDVIRASGGSLHLRHPEILSDADRVAFWRASAFQPSVSEPDRQGSGAAAVAQLVVPSLLDRPSDVGTISESVLHAVDARLSRRRTSLRAETRALLASQPMPENVRTLRNLVIRGALNAGTSELRPDHLDVATGSVGVGVRERVRELERRTIEASLHESAWNVTEAAHRMNLPRRTLVYRMARLGLRRPGHRG